MFANAGISVLKFSVGFEPLYAVAFLNEPWIAVPLDVMSLTFLALTCWTKNGL